MISHEIKQSLYKYKRVVIGLPKKNALYSIYYPGGYQGLHSSTVANMTKSICSQLKEKQVRSICPSWKINKHSLVLQYGCI